MVHRIRAWATPDGVVHTSELVAMRHELQAEIVALTDNVPMARTLAEAMTPDRAEAWARLLGDMAVLGRSTTGG